MYVHILKMHLKRSQPLKKALGQFIGEAIEIVDLEGECMYNKNNEKKMLCHSNY